MPELEQYVTRPRDTLWYVSFTRLGTAARWGEIRDLSGLDETVTADTVLDVGTILTLPHLKPLGT